MENSPPALCPLDSNNYLASPLATILESVNDPQSEIISLHDLTEAYATLSRRIRLQASEISASDQVYLAFTALQAENVTLSLCLIRDIGRCLLNPLSIFSQPESVSDDGLLIEEGTERGQAYATLSHHALVFLSDVFSFVPLTNTLINDQICDLLREVLLILSAPRLPTPSSQKTWSLAVWTLTSQRLHPDILLPHKQTLKKLLLRLVEGTFDGCSLKMEGFKLFSTLLCTHLSEFTDSLLRLYPRILASSLEDPFQGQLQSVETLRCIVAVKQDSSNSGWSWKLASQTHLFIKSHSQAITKRKASRSQSAGVLQSALTSAMKGEDARWDYRGPLWALLFAACCICLSDANLFTQPTSLKLLVAILQQAANHTTTYVRALHPHIWACFVWCYSRLHLARKDVEAAGQDFEKIRKRAFDFVAQELRGGVATALIASILSPSSSSSASSSLLVITKDEMAQVLGLIKTLLSSSKESQIREGVRLLSQLLSTVGVPAPSTQTPVTTHQNGHRTSDIKDVPDILIRDLFRRCFFNVPEHQLRGLTSRLPGPDESLVRPFSEDQIKESWKELVQLWVCAVECTMVPSVRFRQYEDQLMNMWQSLLLVQSQLTSSSSSNDDSMTTRLKMTLPVAEDIASIIINFFPTPGISETSTFATPTNTANETANLVADQRRRLHLVRKLWSVIIHCFGTRSLSGIAESLLSALFSLFLKYLDYVLVNEEIKALWKGLYVDLASVVGSFEMFFRPVIVQEGADEAQRRSLWVVLAEISEELVGKEGLGWEGVLEFLVLPIRLWSLNICEIEVWDRLFKKAIDTAKASSGTPHDTVNALFRKLGGDMHHFKTSPGLIPLLLPHLHFNPDNLLHSDFLSLVNELLVKKYPPPAPEDHLLVLSAFEGIAKVIDTCKADNLVRALLVTREGLGVWIRDEGKKLLEQEHATIVRDIYCHSLSKLSTLPPSLNILQSLSSFLASSFERMGFPPIGPLAFEQFWRSGMYHDQDEKFKRDIPEDLKICLKAWSDHCGDSLAEGVGETQSTTHSLAPDSQLSPAQPCTGDFFSFGDYAYEASRDVDASRDEGSDEEIQKDLMVAPTSDPAPVDLVLSSSQYSQDTPTVKAGIQTPRATTPQMNGPQRYLPSAVGEQSSSVADRVAGRKRFGSESGASGGRVNKRRRTDNETEPRPSSEPPLKSPTQSSSKSRSSFKHNQRDDVSVNLRKHSLLRPSIIQGHQAGSSGSRRRPIVPPSPQAEEFVPERSSTGPITASSPSPFMNAPVIKNMRNDGDDVVDDSMEMMDFLPDSAHHQEDEPRQSRPSSHKRIQSEPAMEINPPSRPTQLKRNCTTSERMGALERAYSLVADSQGSSQIPIEELAHAAHLAHKIGAKIAEQMSKKFPIERA